MESLDRRLLVDVVNTSTLAVTGEGPLYNVLALEVTEEIDRAGVISVTVPATDTRALALASVEALVRLRAADGFTAYGRLQQIASTGGTSRAERTLTGQDLMGELLFPSTGPTAEYDNAVTSAIITSLLSGSLFTSGTVTPSVTPTTLRFEGQTILQALTTLAEQVGDHFRQGTTPRTLDWGVFGGAAVWRFTNVHAQPVLDTSPVGVSYLDQISIADISGQVENRLFPAGSSGFDLRDASSACTGIKVTQSRGGNGASSTAASPVTAGTATVVVASATGFVAGKVVWIGTASNWAAAHEYATISSVVGTTITINVNFTNSYAVGVNVIQAPLFYIEDAASQATYGIRENTPQFQWIGPLSTATTDLQRAADVLYYAAQARLTRYKLPYKSYTLTGALLTPATLRVGNMVRVVYRAASAPFGVTPHENIDADFYVTKITRRYTADGRATAQIEVTDVSRPTPANERFVIFNLDTLRWVGAQAGRGAAGVTGGGLLTLTNNTTVSGGGVIALGGASLSIPTSGTAALGAATATAASVNDATIANHTHAVTATADGDTNTNTILKSGSTGELRIDRLGVGQAVTATAGDVSSVAGGDHYPDGDLRGLAARFITPRGPRSWTDHFRSGVIPTGFAWQGAPFGGTPTVAYSRASEYLGALGGGAARYFMSVAVTNAAASWQNKAIWARQCASVSARIGLRLDDGTDNNYAEVLLDASTNTGGQVLTFRYRAGGGAVTTVTGDTYPVTQLFTFRLLCVWDGANYYVYGYVVNEAGDAVNITNFNTPAIAWAPAAGRVGILLDTTAASGYTLTDWFYNTFT